MPDDRPVLVNRSPAPLPPDLFELSIFNDNRHCRITFGEPKHLFSIIQIVLCVELLKGDATLVVVLASLFAVWTARLCVDFNFQAFSPFSIHDVAPDTALV